MTFLCAKDRALEPVKPVLDGEPRYEKGWFEAYDVWQMPEKKSAPGLVLRGARSAMVYLPKGGAAAGGGTIGYCWWTDKPRLREMGGAGH